MANTTTFFRLIDKPLFRHPCSEIQLIPTTVSSKDQRGITLKISHLQVIKKLGHISVASNELGRVALAANREISHLFLLMGASDLLT